MNVELRSYRIKPGRREEFIEFFETRSLPTLRSHGPLVPESLRSLCLRGLCVQAKVQVMRSC